MRRSIVTHFVLAAALAASACSAAEDFTSISTEESPAGIVAGHLAVSSGADGVLLDNQTERTIFYVAVNRGLLALLDLATCADETKCVHLVAGESRRIAWKDVMGSEAGGNEYVVYWWHAKAGSDGKPVASGLNQVSFKR